MTLCFSKRGSNPPVCGVHNVRLMQHESLEDAAVWRFGDFTFLKCPVSGQVVNDVATHP
jgi:hypothetical protein